MPRGLSDMPTPQRPKQVLPQASVNVASTLDKSLMQSLNFRISSEELKVLEQGGRLEIPPGFKDIAGYMSEATFATGNEVLLFRAKDGKRYIVMGNTSPVTGKPRVRVPLDATRIIAHTHPSGDLSLSRDDIDTLIDMGQKIHALLNPYTDKIKLFFGIR